LDQIEIFFSILQRKLLTPNELTDLDALTELVLAFQDRYNATATPFDWVFTRTDLDRLLKRITAGSSHRARHSRFAFRSISLAVRAWHHPARMTGNGQREAVRAQLWGT
jgi:hypothetical protein